LREGLAVVPHQFSKKNNDLNSDLSHQLEQMLKMHVSRGETMSRPFLKESPFERAGIARPYE
jgi:hypothetical protein